MTAQPRQFYARNGWVKLHRKVLESSVWGNEGLLKVWLWCLLRANHLETWQTMSTGKGKTQVHLLPGQFITGRDSASKELDQKPTTLRKRMLVLQKLGNILLKSDTHWTIVSVCNWDTYQSGAKPKGQASDRQVTGKGQASDTDKNDKNEKKEKKLSAALASPPVENGERRLPETPALDLALRWEELLKLDSRPRSEQKDTGDFRALMTAGEDVLTGKLGQPRQSQDTLTTLAHQIGNRDEPATSPLGMFLAEVGKMRLRQARKAP